MAPQDSDVSERVPRESVDSPEEDELTLTRLLVVWLRRRRVIVLSGVLLALPVGLVVLLMPPRFSSQAAFAPQASRQNAGLSNLATQFGFNLPSPEPNQSPDFYRELLDTPSLLGSVVDHAYPATDQSGATVSSLAELWEIDGDSEAIRRDKAIRKLRKFMRVELSPRTGILRVRVRQRDAVMAQAIVERILDQISHFNLTMRQSQAAFERRFTEQRFERVQEELRTVENELQDFLESNRDFRSSPELVLRNARLERQVQMKQQVVITLAQAYEQARIDEVRDTPVITIVQSPEIPVRRDRRGLLSKSFVALLGGMFLGALLAIALEHGARRDPLPPGAAADAEELGHLWADTKRDITRPWRLVVPKRSATP